MATNASTMNVIASSTRNYQVSEAELKLLRDARDYSETEKKKTIKWFVSHGDPLLSAEEVADIHQSRERSLADQRAAQRAEDRSRTAVDKSNIVTVPSSEHPLYQDEGAAAAPTFGNVVANGIDGRRRLLATFNDFVWSQMLRNRVEARIEKAMKARQALGDTSGAGALARPSMVQAPSGVLALLSMPELLPRLESATTMATPEPPSTANVELFPKKALYEPFEFKLKQYSQEKYSEHHFANADGESVVPVLPAGPEEVPEAVPPGCSSEVPKLDYFKQPIVTLETYPMEPFPFARFDPDAQLIEGIEPLPVSDGGFVPPHHRMDYSHAQPQGTRPQHALWKELYGAPVPQMLKRAAKEDELSDTEDDDDLPEDYPANVDAIMTWLPVFQDPTTGPRRNTESAGKPDRRRSGSKENRRRSTKASTSPPPVVAKDTGLNTSIDASAAASPMPPDLLDFDTKPVHRIGNMTANPVAVQRSNELSKKMQEVIDTLPLPVQLTF